MAAITRRRPDCLIIGAAKAGTTSLFNVLAGHPEIVGSREKEARFFSHDERFERGPAWYADRFFAGAPADAVRMDASPAYLTWSEKVAPRIRESYDGRVALVVILRDPVSRAYSHYCHRVRLGHEPLSFADALAREDSLLRTNWHTLSRTGNGRHGYVRASCYATRLRPFLEYFDRDRLHVLLLDDLGPERFQPTVGRLLTFLEVDPAVRLAPVRVNVPTRARHQGLARAYWRLKKTVAHRIYTTAVPKGVRQAVLPVLFPRSGYPPIDAAIEQDLRVRLADEVRACQDLIGRDLSHWLPS